MFFGIASVTGVEVATLFFARDVYDITARAYFLGGRTFDLVFSQTVALRMRDYALSRDSAYCLPMIYTFQLN